MSAIGIGGSGDESSDLDTALALNGGQTNEIQGDIAHHGTGYGAGVAYAVSRNIEVNAELQHVRFSSASFALSSGEPSVTEFNVGVNYRSDRSCNTRRLAVCKRPCPSPA